MAQVVGAKKTTYPLCLGSEEISGEFHVYKHHFGLQPFHQERTEQEA